MKHMDQFISEQLASPNVFFHRFAASYIREVQSSLTPSCHSTPSHVSSSDSSAGCPASSQSDEAAAATPDQQSPAKSNITALLRAIEVDIREAGREKDKVKRQLLKALNSDDSDAAKDQITRCSWRLREIPFFLEQLHVLESAARRSTTMEEVTGPMDTTLALSWSHIH